MQSLKNSPPASSPVPGIPNEEEAPPIPPSQLESVEPSAAPPVPPPQQEESVEPPAAPPVPLPQQEESVEPPAAPPVPPPQQEESVEPPAAPPVPPPQQESAEEEVTPPIVDSDAPAPKAPPRKASLVGNTLSKPSVTGVESTATKPTEGASNILKSLGEDVPVTQTQSKRSNTTTTVTDTAGATTGLENEMKSITISAEDEQRRNVIQAAVGAQASLAVDEIILKEANLDKYNRWNQIQTRYFILTSKRLMYGKWTDEQHFKCLNILPLGILHAQMADEKEQLAKGVNTFILLSYDKSFHVKSMNNIVSENQGWVDAINEASNHLRGGDGSEMAIALWDVRKNDPSINITQCYLCEAPFGLINRRHHCRKCGHCVCQPCSNQKIVFAMDARYVPVRVCRSCAAEVKDSRKYGTVQNEGEEFDLYDDDDNVSTPK